MSNCAHTNLVPSSRNFSYSANSFMEMEGASLGFGAAFITTKANDFRNKDDFVKRIKSLSVKQERSSFIGAEVLSIYISMYI